MTDVHIPFLAREVCRFALESARGVADTVMAHIAFEMYREDPRARDPDGMDDRDRRVYGRDGHTRSGGYGSVGRASSRDRDRGYDIYDRGAPDSPPYEYDVHGGSRGMSPDGSEPGKALSKTMFIKRHIDEDLDDAEIDKRCVLSMTYCWVFALMF
jgi:hypothetical protein